RKNIAGTRYRVSVTRVTSDTVHFVVWEIEDPLVDRLINRPDRAAVDSAKSSGVNPRRLSDGAQTLYSMPTKQFTESLSLLYDWLEWRVGVFTVPYKLRLNDFAFDANVNIGVNLGARMRFNREREYSFAL